jgi:hypothetical protein
MTRRQTTVFAIVGALLLGACGAIADRAPGAATTVDATKTATVRITQDQTECCYTEGQISFLRLGADGNSILGSDHALQAVPIWMRRVSR